MPSNSSTSRDPIRRIAIVGTGVIGASWATHYLSRGFDVVATDPAANAESNLRKYVDEVIERAVSFYPSIGKKPIRLHKSLPGHAANRLQAAL